MKRSDLRTGVDYAYRGAVGPVKPIRIVDTATLYERFRSDPAQTFRPSTDTSARSSGMTSVGLLAEYTDRPTRRLLVNPRHIVSTWDEYQAAEAIAREAYQAEQAKRQARFAVVQQQAERIAKLLTEQGIADRVRVAPNVAVQRVPNDVLLALLLRAAR